MTQPIIHEPNGYEAVVAELRRIADALEALPPGVEPSYVGIDIHAGPRSHASAVSAVDAVGLTLLGKAGTTQLMSGGTYQHAVVGDWSDPVQISVYQSVPAPEPVHYLEPGSGDGDLTDVLACGLTVATSGSGYVEDEARVTCPACRAAAQLDHSQACRDQDADRPCRLDCPARGDS